MQEHQRRAVAGLEDVNPLAAGGYFDVAAVYRRFLENASVEVPYFVRVLDRRHVDYSLAGWGLCSGRYGAREGRFVARTYQLRMPVAWYFRTTRRG
jgi:hypothetical protein